MNAELRDSLAPLFSDSRIGRKPCREMSVDVARGGTASVNILLTGLEKGRKVSLSARPSGGVRVFRLIDVPVEKNTGPVGFVENEKSGRNPFVVRRAPFRVFDALEPTGGSFAAPGQTAAVRLCLPVPRSAKPGRREIEVRVRAGSEECLLVLDVTVFRAVIPAAGRDSLFYTNWFPLTGMASRHGLKRWSNAHFSMVGKYAGLMRHARQNTFLLPLHDLFRRTKSGLELDRGRLRRLVGVFTRAGLHYIEGGHWAGRTGGEWDSPTFSVSLGGPVVSTPEGDLDIARGAGQLMDEIDRNGWRKRWIQHATDEPTDKNASDYRILVGIVRKYMPGLPILDATCDLGLAGSVDIWCPQCQEYQKHREEFDARRETGDGIWFYTCCFPGGPWLNRLLDQELLRPALFGWAAARFSLDGFLHWGFNYFKSSQDPFRQSVVDHGHGNFLPAGDTHIAYPGKGGPWSSARLEAQREGFEDYELLKRLRERDAKAASRVIRLALRGFKDYTKDVGVFRAARRDLLTRASRVR